MHAPTDICSLLNAAAARPSRSVIVLGASGSVGGSTLDFIKACPEAGLTLAAVSVHGSVDKLRRILSEHTVRRAAISSRSAFEEHVAGLRLEYSDVTFYGGDAGMLEMIEASVADDGADTILTAVVGAAGIQATMLGLRLGLKIALANKETMVTAGPAIEALLRERLAAETPERCPVILPVDSEHNAIFQLIYALKPDHLKRVILTASGGPFRDWPLEKLKAGVDREQVLNHPTWSMGPKITVDSAGMINKGLELIEAHYLFSLPYDQLDVLIHKHSLVHGLAETTDGGYLICASRPHMVFPIAHALCYPARVPAAHECATEPQTWPGLEFEQVSEERYPGFSLCVRAGQTGGTAPAILNAANEEAVRLFLEGALTFHDIPRLIEHCLDEVPVEYGTELEIFLEADRQARDVAGEAARLRR